MTDWISAEHVFDGTTLLLDHSICLRDGQVSDIQPTHLVSATRHHRGLITPGFFDIQVNGGGGVMLNSEPNAAGIKAIAAAHRQFGTTAILPTVITDRPEVLEQAVAASIAAKDTPGVKGLHIEGPHIAPARRGTHAAEYLRVMDADTLGLVKDLRVADVPVLITVAPEATTFDQIAQLRALGAVVSIGHSDATLAEAQAAVDAGATCFTHLFNAMSQMQSRAPGVVGAAINSDAWCSIIADGIHVDPAMITLAWRARPVADRMIAISDAMATVGGPDDFTLYGQEIALRAGRLVNAEGALAGAHLTMHAALRNLVSYGIDLQNALRMCTQNPAALMGLPEVAKLQGSQADDVVLLSSSLDLVAVGLSPSAL